MSQDFGQFLEQGSIEVPSSESDKDEASSIEQVNTFYSQVNKSYWDLFNDNPQHNPVLLQADYGLKMLMKLKDPPVNQAKQVIQHLSENFQPCIERLVKLQEQESMNITNFNLIENMIRKDPKDVEFHRCLYDLEVASQDSSQLLRSNMMSFIPSIQEVLQLDYSHLRLLVEKKLIEHFIEISQLDEQLSDYKKESSLSVGFIIGLLQAEYIIADTLIIPKQVQQQSLMEKWKSIKDTEEEVKRNFVVGLIIQSLNEQQFSDFTQEENDVLLQISEAQQSKTLIIKLLKDTNRVNVFQYPIRNVVGIVNEPSEIIQSLQVITFVHDLRD